MVNLETIPPEDSGSCESAVVNAGAKNMTSRQSAPTIGPARAWFMLIICTTAFGAFPTRESFAHQHCESHPGFHRTTRYCWDDGDFLPPITIDPAQPLSTPPKPAIPEVPPHVTLRDGKYEADDGYTFNNANEDDLTVRWTPGRYHTLWPHVFAGKREGQWDKDEGYVWESPNSESNFEVKWHPGAKHSQYPNIHASFREGYWTADEGYQFVHSDDFAVEPIPNYWEKENLRANIQQATTDIADQDQAIQTTLRRIKYLSHGIWDAERTLDHWLLMSEQAKAQARAVALDALWDVTQDSFTYIVKPWAVKQIPPADLVRITTAIDQFTRKNGKPYRKIELHSRRFLKDAYERIKGIKEKYEFGKKIKETNNHWEEQDYYLAVGSLIEAGTIAFEVPKPYSDLITISVKDGEIWIATIYAYWNSHDARRIIDKMSELQSDELEEIKTLSKTYEIQIQDKREMTREREDLIERFNSL